MLYYIEVSNKESIKGVVAPKDFRDPAAGDVVSAAKDLHVKGVSRAKVSQLYLVDADFAKKDAVRVAEEILIDPVINDYSIGKSLHRPRKADHIITVFRKPGVMDPVEASILKGIADLGLSARAVRVGRKYVVSGPVTKAGLNLLARKALANEAVDDIAFAEPSLKEIPAGKPYVFKKVVVPVRVASDDRLRELDRKYTLSLNLDEMRTIKEFFIGLDRDPTDIELETIAQTWSEHCKHKTLTGRIDFDGVEIDNLLKNTVMRATTELNRPWCISVFKDNAGIIEFDNDNAVCFKVETHNHPSAIDPYGGSNTGIGGVIRDILGCGLGAKPVLNTDVFCVGLPDAKPSDIPKGALHPKRVLKGVVAGVRDYGNRMGIPTCNGAVFFDERYTGNPLVFCGTVGVMPKNKVQKAAKEGDLVVVMGGRTGRDGIHGATFSSAELTHESETVSSGAVQIGNAITEKIVLDALLQARDLGLYTCVTDCGAGGLSSAVGEMGEELGAEIELARVPLKYEGLSYTEIWISEAQERMVISVPPANIDRIMELFKMENVEATVLGKFTGTGRLELYYKANKVADLPMKFLHDGVPRLARKAEWIPKKFPEPPRSKFREFTGPLLGILSSLNVCSKEWIIRQYDHEVQAGSAVKSLVGPNFGPGDACVIRPVLSSPKGLAVSNGMSPKFGDIDPYWMAASSIDEALRNIIAVGGNLDRTAILDNFCWGNTNKPDRLGSLVRASEACYEIAKAFGTPFISGKDSLNNEFATEKGTIVIPPSLLISAICVMPDASKAISMDFKAAGNLVYVAGVTSDELGGSHYWALSGFKGNSVPKVKATLNLRVMKQLSLAMERGTVRSCHDCSEGGFAVAAAEMCLAGGVGASLLLKDIPNSAAHREEVLLFSESNGRFVIEVERGHHKDFESVMKGLPVACVGETVVQPRLVISDLTGRPVVNASIEDMKEAWSKPLRW